MSVLEECTLYPFSDVVQYLWIIATQNQKLHKIADVRACTNISQSLLATKFDQANLVVPDKGPYLLIQVLDDESVCGHDEKL